MTVLRTKDSFTDNKTMENLMKKMQLLLLLVVLLLLTSCGILDPKYPSLWEPVLNPTKDFYLLIGHRLDANSREESMYMSLYCKVTCNSVKLNETFFNPGSPYFGNNGYYKYEFEIPDGAWSVLAENNLNYEISFPAKTVVSSIRVPDLYTAQFPVFNSAQDYQLNWTIATDPDYQSVALDLLDGGHHNEYESADFSGSVRKYRWKKSEWKDLSSPGYSGTYLKAHNYQKANGGLVWVLRSLENDNSKQPGLSPRIPFQELERLLQREP